MLAYPTKISSPFGLKDDQFRKDQSRTRGYQQGQVNQNADEINSLMYTQRKESRKYKEEKEQSKYEDVQKVVSQTSQTTTGVKYPSRGRFQGSRENRKYPQEIIKVSEPVIQIETDRGQQANQVKYQPPNGNHVAFAKQVNQLSEQSIESKPELTAIGVHPPNTINIKPYQQSIGPDPQTCPCYLVEPSNNTATTTSTTSIPLIGQLGFIPVVFVPYCPGDDVTDSTQNMKDMFPSAMPVPYACDACDSQNGRVETKLVSLNQLGNIENLREALRQAKLGFLNVSARGQTERRRAKLRNVK